MVLKKQNKKLLPKYKFHIFCIPKMEFLKNKKENFKKQKRKSTKKYIRQSITVKPL